MPYMPMEAHLPKRDFGKFCKWENLPKPSTQNHPHHHHHQQCIHRQCHHFPYHLHLSPPFDLPCHPIHDLPSHANAAGFNARSAPGKAPTNWTRNRNWPQRKPQRTTKTNHRWWGRVREWWRVGRRVQNVPGTLPSSPHPHPLTFFKKMAANHAQEDTAADTAGAPSQLMR